VTGRLELRDTRVVGLVLRMTPSGTATWSLRTRTRDGRQTRPTLGSWPAMGIAEARRAALATLCSVQAGADPVAAKRAARAQRETRLAPGTVAERLADWRAARQEDRSHPRSPRYAAEVRRICEQVVVPALGPVLLSETKREDWTRLIRDRKRELSGARAKSGRMRDQPPLGDPDGMLVRRGRRRRSFRAWTAGGVALGSR
jgi:hypothetical protein